MTHNPKEEWKEALKLERRLDPEVGFPINQPSNNEYTVVHEPTFNRLTLWKDMRVVSWLTYSGYLVHEARAFADSLNAAFKGKK